MCANCALNVWTNRIKERMVCMCVCIWDERNGWQRPFACTFRIRFYLHSQKVLLVITNNNIHINWVSYFIWELADSYVDRKNKMNLLSSEHVYNYQPAQLSILCNHGMDLLHVSLLELFILPHSISMYNSLVYCNSTFIEERRWRTHNRHQFTSIIMGRFCDLVELNYTLNANTVSMTTEHNQKRKKKNFK